MGQMNISNLIPNYVYVQATEPTDKTQGKLWYNTTNKILYASDGINYIQVAETDVTYLQSLINENAVSILELQATNNLTGTQSVYMIRDVYSDNNGYLNTINTSNTDAYYDSTNKQYKNLGGNNETLNQGGAITDSQSETNSGGYKITIGPYDVKLISVTKANGCTATNCYVSATRGGSAIPNGTATFSGDTATFSTPPILSANTSYWVFAGSNGSQYTRKLAHTPTYPFPVNGTYFSLITSYWNSSDTTEDILKNITSITIEALVPGNLKVQTDTQTLPITPSKFQIFTFKPTTQGDGNIKYDVSFNNGTNYQTDLNDNTEYNITNTGTQLIIKQKLNKGSSDNLVTAKGYALMFW